LENAILEGISPDSAARMGIGLEPEAPTANLLADDWIESNNLREDFHAFLTETYYVLV